MQGSYANLLLSVRRITQTDTGKATAGIDKEVIACPRATDNSGKKLERGKPQTNKTGRNT